MVYNTRKPFWAPVMLKAAQTIINPVRRLATMGLYTTRDITAIQFLAARRVVGERPLLPSDHTFRPLDDLLADSHVHHIPLTLQ
jgi:hypothetical protein